MDKIKEKKMLWRIMEVEKALAEIYRTAKAKKDVETIEKYNILSKKWNNLSTSLCQSKKLGLKTVSTAEFVSYIRTRIKKHKNNG